MITSILLFVCIAIVVLFNFEYDKSTTVLLSIVIIAIIIYLVNNNKLVKRTRKSKSSLGFLGEILKVVFVLLVFCFFLINIKSPKLLTQKSVEAIVETEEVVLYTDSSETSFEKYYQSKQTWYDFQRRKHVLKFRIDYDNVIKSKANRESLKSADFRRLIKTESGDKSKPPLFTLTFSWNKLYKKLVQNDKPLVESLALEFYKYQAKRKLNRKQFAELMITAIQDIPYGLVLSDSCKVNEIKPCIGNIKFGLFSPGEYVSNLHGDCDTRTVLLFTLLSRFNYDVAILNSKSYRHSILGLNIPSTGKYKRYKYKKYYFIETTTKGCPIGFLSTKFSNIDSWKFTLMHNTNI